MYHKVSGYILTVVVISSLAHIFFNKHHISPINFFFVQGQYRCRIYRVRTYVFKILSSFCWIVITLSFVHCSSSLKIRDWTWKTELTETLENNRKKTRKKIKSNLKLHTKIRHTLEKQRKRYNRGETHHPIWKTKQKMAILIPKLIP